MLDEIKKTTLKIIYTKSLDYKLLPATGCWGGPNPQGEIICNFWVEQQSFPISETIELHDQYIGVPISSEIPQESIRELSVGIVIRPDIAKNIGQWLINNADKIMSLQKNLTPQ